MTFVAAAALFVIAGLAILRLARLETGGAVADIGLAWLVGSGWFAAVVPALRFGLGVPVNRLTAAAVVVVPIAAWAAVWIRGRRGESRGHGVAEWIPRPLWAYLPMVAYVAVVVVAVLLHGIGTPTHTDDGVRVRAFAPVLAFADTWPPEARAIFVQAGPLPTFVPVAGWILAGTVHPFHVNYSVLAELIALLLLVVGLAASRGSPARGWASAFGLLSIPLFVYHCTSTYSDAVLAMRLAGGVLFGIEYARSREGRDAARALLLLGLATLVKREGELVAVAPAALLVVQIAAERARGHAVSWSVVAGFGAVIALEIVGKIAAVGISHAFPMLRLVAQQSGVASAASSVAPRDVSTATRVFFELALLRSGNAGMIFWALPAAVLIRARALVRTRLVWSLAAVAALLAEVAVSSIWIVPRYTLDQSTVHRALLVVTVPAALWLATVLTDAAAERGERGADSTGGAEQPARAAKRRRQKTAKPSKRPRRA